MASHTSTVGGSVCDLPANSLRRRRRKRRKGGEEPGSFKIEGIALKKCEVPRLFNRYLQYDILDA